jgi:GNAT superfamily N-acetyltransferase
MDVRDLHPGDELLSPVAALFDDYRVHYGFTREPSRTGAWLRDQLETGRLALAATSGVTGFITTVALPASLRLAEFRQVRDLYVAPPHRRAGVARALLTHAAGQARDAGAVRLSLQTEHDNGAALQLYRAMGFEPVEGLTLLSLPLGR